MNILGNIFGGGAATVVNSVGGVLDNLFTSDEERLEAERLQSIIDDKPNQDQRDTNKIEAAAGKGWRHWVGRVAAISLGLYFIPQYTVSSIVWIKMCWEVVPVNGIWNLPAYPASVDGLMELITAMLGLGAIKGFEVITGKRRAS